MNRAPRTLEEEEKEKREKRTTLCAKTNETEEWVFFETVAFVFIKKVQSKKKFKKKKKSKKKKRKKSKKKKLDEMHIYVFPFSLIG